MAFAGDAPPFVPRPYNQGAYQELTDAFQLQGVEAVLLTYNTEGESSDPAWKFLINPRSLSFSESADYVQVSPHAARVPTRFYMGASGLTLTIADMVMSTYCLGKTLRPLMEGARELLKAKPDEDQFAPPLLVFAFGTRQFQPCILLDVQWDESAWLGGEPAYIRMSMTLAEVPRPLTQAEKDELERQRQEREADLREEAAQPRTELSDRLAERAEELADLYLDNNNDIWNDQVRAALADDTITYDVNRETGDVLAIAADGSSLGRIGRFDGEELRTGRNWTDISFSSDNQDWNLQELNIPYDATPEEIEQLIRQSRPTPQS